MSDPLLDLVAQALGRLEQGGPAELHAFCAAHPAHRARILQRLGSLRRMGLIDVELGDDAGADDATPRRLGDFELGRRLGAGGMGVVYEARQTSLDRVVALKLVRPEHVLFPGTRERFEREIQAVARLQHDSIVRVHTVGVDRGVPFLAMEKVAGATLADVLRALHERRPAELGGEDLWRTVCRLCGHEPGAGEGPHLFTGSWVRACFRIAERVAEALAHAHARGVLHRDVKPGNVMITPAGRVVLMDFGLASLPGGDRLTRTGAQLGSLPYMAPEQVTGAAVIDARADVYGLGVTLYEMLCLRLPFANDDQEALRAAILRGEAAPPARHNSAVAWDGETICLVAMAAEPERRYPSAAALQRDIHHYLDLRPIAARRPGPLLRLRRWMQRHPAWTASALIASLAVGATNYALHARERAAEVVRLVASRQLDAAHLTAESNLRLAITSIEHMLGRIAGSELADVAGFDRLCLLVLDDASGFLRQLAARNATRSDLQFALARTLAAAAAARLRIGDLLAAEEDGTGALATLAWEDGRGDETERLALLSNVRGTLAATRLHAGDPEAAGDLWREALADAEELAARCPGDVVAQREQGRSVMGLAGLALGNGVLDVARQGFAAVARLRTAVHGSTAASEDLADLADAHLELAGVLQRLGDRVAAAGIRSASRTVLEAALQQTPADTALGQRFAAVLHALAADALAAGQRDEAIALALRAAATAADLERRAPVRTGPRQQRASAHALLASALLEAGRKDEAAALLPPAIAALEQLHAAVPASSLFFAELAFALGVHARLLAATGQRSEAGRAWDQAAELLAGALAKNGRNNGLHLQLATLLEGRARCTWQASDRRQAAAWFAGAADHLEAVRALAPQDRQASGMLVRVRALGGQVLHELDQREAALGELRKMLAAGEPSGDLLALPVMRELLAAARERAR